MFTRPSSADGVRRVCLFEDAAVAGLEPVALTRPAFDLLCGLTSLGDKQRRAFTARSVGALVRPHLADVTQFCHPDVAALPRRPAGGCQVRHLGEVVRLNAGQIVRDFTPGEPSAPPGLVLVRPVGRQAIDPRAKVEPMAFADTTGGPARR